VWPDRRPDSREAFRLEMRPFVHAMRVVSAAWGVVAAAATSALVAIVAQSAGIGATSVRALAAGAFLLTALATLRQWTRRWTLVRVAGDLERRASDLDNVIVTAAEAIESPRRPLHPVVADAVWAVAHQRLAAAASYAPAVSGPLAAAVLCVAAAAALVWSLPETARLEGDTALRQPTSGSSNPPTIGELRVHITPPRYTGRPMSEVVNPEAISVLDGSQVRLDVTADENVRLIDPGQATIDLIRSGKTWTHTFVPTVSRVLLLQPAASGEPRLLHIRVEPDRRPSVRIEAPARDLVVADDRGRVPVEIAAEDDLALSTLTLRYTRVAGSGESFTFEEGDVPLAIRRGTDANWQARATLVLDGLQLEAGDTLVYRALAGDAVPGREPSASETYIIEIGRPGGVASTGFAVPEERDRQALSQQMVIIKTERLHATRTTLGSEALLEQSRLLAVEQRMVRAEFVFMTGGHVEDEVAEAEAGHEIVEGRLENEAQVELLNAIREMSRAEARLNDGDTAQALVFERAALRALQRAFDRRRYLLRTLPERTRIDVERRLTGDREEARAVRQAAVSHPPDPAVAAAREVLAAMGAEADTPSAQAALAARIIAVDPQNADLQSAGVRVAAAGDVEASRAARADAQRILIEWLFRRMGEASGGRVLPDALAGRVGEALNRRTR
jgi:hypothetical protein